jgi:hypothetical protein
VLEAKAHKNLKAQFTRCKRGFSIFIERTIPTKGHSGTIEATPQVLDTLRCKNENDNF